MAKSIRGRKILTPEFRISFPAIHEPVENQQGKLRYTVTMIFEKTEELAEMKQVVKELIQSAWPEGAPHNAKIDIFKDGNLKLNRDGVLYDGYANTVFSYAGSVNKPGCADNVLDPTTNSVRIISDTNEIQDKFSIGNYARATVVPYTYDNVSRGVSFGLNNIQFIKKGTGGAGVSNPAADFAPIKEMQEKVAGGILDLDAELGL